MNIINARDVIVKNVSITESWAHSGAGGGINYECGVEDLDCSLEISESEITRNKAMQGGGIRWRDKKPIFNGRNKLHGNEASLYGHNNASYPTKMVRFVS